MANYSTYFKDVPCIFAAVNSPSKAEEAYTKYGMEEIVETAPISETIELAEKIYPDASQIVVVTDDTVTGKGNL
jgi:ABC-type uncharacterized transport system substrate-binding protein